MNPVAFPDKCIDARRQYLKKSMALQAILSSQRDGQLELQLQEVCQRLLVDEEPRVRLTAGECLGLLAKLRGVSVWTDYRTALLDSIQHDYVSLTYP